MTTTNNTNNNMTETVTIRIVEGADFFTVNTYLHNLREVGAEIDTEGILMKGFGNVCYTRKMATKVHSILDNNSERHHNMHVYYHETEEDEIEISDYSKDILSEYRTLIGENMKLHGIEDDSYELSTQCLVEMLLNFGLTSFRNSVENYKANKEVQ